MPIARHNAPDAVAAEVKRRSEDLEPRTALSALRAGRLEDDARSDRRLTKQKEKEEERRAAQEAIMREGMQALAPLAIPGQEPPQPVHQSPTRFLDAVRLQSGPVIDKVAATLGTETLVVLEKERHRRLDNALRGSAKADDLDRRDFWSWYRQQHRTIDSKYASQGVFVRGVSGRQQPMGESGVYTDGSVDATPLRHRDANADVAATSKVSPSSVLRRDREWYNSAVFSRPPNIPGISSDDDDDDTAGGAEKDRLGKHNSKRRGVSFDTAPPPGREEPLSSPSRPSRSNPSYIPPPESIVLEDESLLTGGGVDVSNVDAHLTTSAIDDASSTTIGLATSADDRLGGDAALSSDAQAITKAELEAQRCMDILKRVNKHSRLHEVHATFHELAMLPDE